LELLVREADVLSIHVPLNFETEKMIGSKELNLLPKNAYLINTSRGAILDEDALLDAVQGGRLAGAALDVLAGERQSTQDKRSPLIEYAHAHSNLLITPHIGGATYESMRATEVFMVNKLRHYIENHSSKFV
jgi:D-3-phosphoglycerate dehydrogenase